MFEPLPWPENWKIVLMLWFDTDVALLWRIGPMAFLIIS